MTPIINPLRRQPPPLPTLDASRTLRQALKAAYPGVSFGLRKTVNADGVGLRASWTDGPLVADVAALASAVVGPGLAYAFLLPERSYSAEFLERRARRVARDWRIPTPIVLRGPWGNGYVSDDGRIVQGAGETAATLVYQQAHRTRGVSGMA
jgi:hypothetical protein